jgi:hypothetical protein
MAKVGVIKIIKLPVYSKEIARIMAPAVAFDIKSRASRIARKAFGTLRASIQVQKLSADHWEVYSSLAYAAAQEWGRPDLKNYGFTPYMRPATDDTTSQGNLNRLVKEAEKVARSRSKA